MNKKHLGTLICLATLVGCQNQNENSENEEVVNDKLPNILWLTVEDMSPHLGCYGSTIVQTPNIDKLSEEGIRYTNAFSTSGVCAPSRFTLITGMYPTACGAQHMRTLARTSALDKITDPELLDIPVYEAVPPKEVKCFSEFLRQKGYYTTNNKKTDYQFKNPVTAWDESSENAHYENRPEGKPFFAVFNHVGTHESQIWESKDEPLLVKPEDVNVPPYYPDNVVVRKDIARHLTNVIKMDEWVGEMLAELEESGEAENTIIFFFSDHGDGLPRAKRWTYESGIHVPLIVKFPDGQGAGMRCRDLVSFVDFAPTVLSIVGINIPEYMQGQAFLGGQKSDVLRQFVYASRDRMDPAIDCQRTARDRRFKYVRNYMPDKPYVQFLPYRDQMDLMKELLKAEKQGALNEDQKIWFSKVKPQEELYDLSKDPFELNNLAEHNDYKRDIHRLQTALDDWLELTNDPLAMPENELLKEKIWPPDGIQPQTSIVKFSKVKEKVELTCETKGASIGYQLNDKIGGESWQLYIEPFEVNEGDKIKAVAIRIGFKQSEPAEL